MKGSVIVSKKENKNRRKKRNKNKKLWPKILIGVAFVLIFSVTAFAVYGISLINKMDTVDIDKSNLGITSKEDLKKYENHDSIKNIALFGVDAEEGQFGRSDSIMIATIDPIHKKIKVTSIMRDSYVNIDGHGMDKINHAYAFGGPELAIKTLNENFGLNIEDFVTVNFSTLPQIIDTLGGVEIPITEEEVSHVPGIGAAGTYNLTGEQALEYTRIRYASGGDYERTHRQRNVMSALFKKAIDMPVSTYPSVLTNILPLVQTSLKTSDILSLGTKALSMGTSDLQQERFPQDGDCWGDSIDGIYYLVFDSETVKTKMRDYIFDDILK